MTLSTDVTTPSSAAATTAEAGRWARLMTADAVGRIVVEVADAAHELPIDAPPGVIVEQLHRDGSSAGSSP